MPNTWTRIITHQGIQYMWDMPRGKLLSVPKVYLRAGTHRRTVTDEHLRLEDGQPAMTVGDDLLRDATIIGISANCETNSTWSAKVFKKGDPSPLVTLNMLWTTHKEDTSIDMDVAAGSVLLFKVEGTNIPFPRVILELAWKL